jgi:hypothetical protein
VAPNKRRIGQKNIAKMRLFMAIFLQTNFQPCCQAQTFRYFATPLAIVIAGYTTGAIYSFNRNLFEYSSAIYSKFTSKNLATGSDWI